MTTLIIQDSSSEAKKFIEFAKTLPFVKEREPECIPGLPYTMEERIAAIHEAETNYKQGVPGISHEEMVDKMQKKMDSWK